MTGEPFTPLHTRKLIRQILQTGTVSFSTHALKEMAKDNLTTVDCTNVLRSGVVEPPELRENLALPGPDSFDLCGRCVPL